ncbi:MAG: DUF2007 domain-containing protein [Verrucomicrobiota bacterium]
MTETAYETGNPIEAQILAARLRDLEIPVYIANEANFLLGYGAATGPIKLLVPKDRLSQVKEILAGEAESISIPDDPEFEDLEEATPLGAWEWGAPKELFRWMLFLGAALGLLLLAAFIGDLIGFFVFVR